jgi:hypothetical protein
VTANTLGSSHSWALVVLPGIQSFCRVIAATLQQHPGAVAVFNDSVSEAAGLWVQA